MLLVHRLANTLRLCPQDLSSGSGRHVKIHLKIWRKKQMVCYGALKKKNGLTKYSYGMFKDTFVSDVLLYS